MPNNRETLEAFVATGDTSVPGIEASDINDGDILSRTRENVNANGQFQFVYIPEDGTEPIKSDWISQDHKKKVTGSWVEGVKGAIIARANAKMEEARNAHIKKVRDEQLHEHSAPAEAPVAVQVARPAAATGDPSAYVNEQVEIARERLRNAESQQNEIIKEVLVARKAYDKWVALLNAMNAPKENAQSQALSVN